jgi:hypothetical protein
MEATGFGRPATAFAAVSLAVMIGAVAIGQARAQQPVNPPITMPPPTFNPSTPNTVPQPPPAPLTPTQPSGPSAVPGMPALVPPAVTPPTENAPATEAKPAPTHAHARHHGRRRRHARFHAVRVRGPSYYPGLGLVPPSVNPCHFRRVWSGYGAGEWDTYTCS